MTKASEMLVEIVSKDMKGELTREDWESVPEDLYGEMLQLAVTMVVHQLRFLQGVRKVAEDLEKEVSSAE